MIAFQNQSLAIATSGDNTVISGVTGAQIRIWYIVAFNRVATAQSVTVKDGSNSLTGAIALPSSIGGGFVLGDGLNPLFILSSGNAFILNLAAATGVDGFVKYTVA